MAEEKQIWLGIKRKYEEDTVSKKRSKNFPVSALHHQACLKVSYKAYADIQKRFQVLYLPECVDKKCIHFGTNANIVQIPAAAEKYFNIEIKNKAWHEAIEICLMCINSHQYLPESMLKEIVEIMMNAHENFTYTIEYIMKQCQQALLLNFNMHPPCISKAIRDCYKNFLTSPMDKKEKTLSNRINYHSEEGIVSHCFSRLLYEISIESSDDTLIDKQENSNHIDAVRRINWMKENFELFECLERTERIERLMLILECLINLLQTDLALCHSRCLTSNQGSRTRSLNPLMSNILWPNSPTDTDRCRKIIKIFAYFIHLKYPEQHIKTMTLWMNTVIQTYYMQGLKTNEDYPNIDNSYRTLFAKEFCDIISCLPTISKLKIMEKVQPSFMRYFIGLHLIQNMLNTKEFDIMSIIISCVNNRSWEKYPQSNDVYTLPINDFRSTIEPQKLLDILSENCRNVLSENRKSGQVSINHYSKLSLNRENDRIYKDYFINLLSITFVAYLESYNILSYKQASEYCENLHGPSTSKEFDTSSYEPYLVNDHFIKKYVSTLESLNELKIILPQKEDEVSKNLLSLINRFFP